MTSSKIAILSLPYGPNYGCLLQQWALYTFIKNLGYDVIVLNRRWNRKTSIITQLKTFFYLNFFIRKFTKFYAKITHSNEIRSSKELVDFIRSEKIDTVVVGSDQIWRIEYTRGADLNFFCDFADECVKKISYAASFGIEKWNGTLEETVKIASLLKKFYAVSVREKSGVALCKSLFDCSAVQVLDPTLLLNASDYGVFLGQKRENFLGTYILDNSPEINLQISKIALQLKLNEIALYPHKKRKFSFYKTIPQWVSYIYNSNYMIVDSFHGLVFSILFHRQFIVLINKNRGESRIRTLLSEIGLENRAVEFLDENSINLLKLFIDYNMVEKKLAILREKSKKFICCALES